MDKKSIIGLLLIGVILFGFSWYNNNLNKKAQQEKAIADSIYRAQNPIEEVPVNTAKEFTEAATANAAINADSATMASADVARENYYGVALAAASKGEEQFFTVENDVAKYTFSNKGGRITGVELKDYKKYNGGQIEMFDSESARFDMNFFIKRQFNNLELNTGDFYFSTDAPRSIAVAEGETERIVSMKLHIDSTSYVEYLYVIQKDNYMLDFKVNFVNMASLLDNQPDFSFAWENKSYHNERGFKNENNYTNISYLYPGDKYPENLSMSDGTKSDEIKSRVSWIAFKQQFFSSVFIAKNDFQNASVKFDTHKPESGFVKDFSARISVPMSMQETSYDFQFYFGPNKYSILKKYDIKAEKLIQMGGWMIGWVNYGFVIPIIDFLSKFISNFGLIILILTIIVKLVISPLTYKSYLSQAKMRLLKPEIDELTAKYPKQEDAMKKQQATMELYKKAGVSPMGGCIPMLIQMPILFALFRFFPTSIELRGESFLWAKDLSSYDSILSLPFDIPFFGDHVSLFTLLMAVSMYITSKINYNQTASSAPQMAGMKFMMLYMMPVFMLFAFNNYASGLTYYFFLSNFFTLAQTYAFRYAVDDNKLHAQMKANTKKPVKKNKFQQRYDDLLKSQQQMQKQQNKRR